MKITPILILGLLAVGLSASSCQSARIEKKAEDYRRSGVARDMGEARRLAENFYWPAGAQIADSERRQRSEIFPLKRDAGK